MAQTGETYRIYRNSEADFTPCNDLKNTDVIYSDAWFENLRANGFNGFWLNIWMRKLVAFREPENSEQIKNQDIVKRLIDRAARHGIGFWLYLNEPKAFKRTNRIWKRFPGMKGAPGTWPKPELMELYLLCTSSAEGRDYVYENARRVHQLIPDIAGTIHINASESPTHCYCHTITNPGGIIFSSNQEHEGVYCPRCAERTPENVIAEILNLYHRGCRDAGSKAPVIAWNWDWAMYSEDPQAELIEKLNPDIEMMSDFEIGGRMRFGDRERPVNEYSLIFPGPSDKYISVRDKAVKHGHKHAAKLQVGTTHELASVANMPLLGNIYEKLDYLLKDGSSGFLGAWNFGCRFTMNTGAVDLFFEKNGKFENKKAFLRELGEIYFGLEQTNKLDLVIDKFEQAFKAYPLSNKMLYWGPINFALAMPLDNSPLQGRPLTSSWQNLERGDNWRECYGGYTGDEIISGFREMADLFGSGMKQFEQLLFSSMPPGESCLAGYRGAPVITHSWDRLDDAEKTERLRSVLPEEAFEQVPELAGIHGARRLMEWCNASSVLCMIESVRNLFENYAAKLRNAPDYAETLARLRKNELDIVERALPVFCLDERLGLHIECATYFVNPAKLESKRRFLAEH